MNLEESRTLFNEFVTSEKIKLHCREVETVMAHLAEATGEDKEKWAIAGLMHDVDCDVEPDIMNQGRRAVEILKERTDCPEDICQAILAHNEENIGVMRESKLDYALSAADNISGLIFAYALMRKGIEDMKVSGLKKKLKNEGFAASVRRGVIYDIEKAGMELDAFLATSIAAMQSIGDEIGLTNLNEGEQ